MRDQRAALRRPCTSPQTPRSFFLSAPSSPLSASRRGSQNSRMFLEFKTYHQGFIKDFLNINHSFFFFF